MLLHLFIVVFFLLLVVIQLYEHTNTCLSILPLVDICVFFFNLGILWIKHSHISFLCTWIELLDHNCSKGVLKLLHWTFELLQKSSHPWWLSLSIFFMGETVENSYCTMFIMALLLIWHFYLFRVLITHQMSSKQLQASTDLFIRPFRWHMIVIVGSVIAICVSIFLSTCLSLSIELEPIASIQEKEAEGSSPFHHSIFLFLIQKQKCPRGTSS